MKNFKFNGTFWFCMIKARHLSQWNKKEFHCNIRYAYSPEEIKKAEKEDAEYYKSLLKGSVRFYLEVPKPNITQTKTINYIIENQKEIIKTVYTFLADITSKEVEEKEEEDGYDMIYPRPKIVDDLRNIIGIRGVEILNKQKEGQVYYVLIFTTCWGVYQDNYTQGGLCLLLYKNNIIDWGLDEVNYDIPFLEKIAKDGGY